MPFWKRGKGRTGDVRARTEMVRMRRILRWYVEFIGEKKHKRRKEGRRPLFKIVWYDGAKFRFEIWLKVPKIPWKAERESCPISGWSIPLRSSKSWAIGTGLTGSSARTPLLEPHSICSHQWIDYRNMISRIWNQNWFLLVGIDERSRFVWFIFIDRWHARVFFRAVAICHMTVFILPFAHPSAFYECVSLIKPKTPSHIHVINVMCCMTGCCAYNYFLLTNKPSLPVYRVIGNM